jgi:hypothetical protein
MTPDQAQAALDEAVERGRFTSIPERGMEAAPEAPGWLVNARRRLEGIETGGDLASPTAITQALLALEQGRKASYLDIVGSELELTDPMVLGAMAREWLR